MQIFGALDAPYPARWTAALAGALADALDALERRAKIPQLLLREGKPSGLHVHPGHAVRRDRLGARRSETFSCLLDRFYAERAPAGAHTRRRRRRCAKHLTNLRNRTARKLENQRMELDQRRTTASSSAASAISSRPTSTPSPAASRG